MTTFTPLGDGLYSADGLVEDPPGSGLYAFEEFTPPISAGALGGVLRMGRARAESRMTETVTFYRVTGTEPDPVTLQDVDVILNLHLGIRARLKLSTLTVSERNIPGQQIAVQAPEIHVPVGLTPDVRVNDFCVITGSTVDVSLVGRKFRVSGMPQGGQTTAHRYPVEEVS